MNSGRHLRVNSKVIYSGRMKEGLRVTWLSHMSLHSANYSDMENAQTEGPSVHCKSAR